MSVYLESLYIIYCACVDVIRLNLRTAPFQDTIELVSSKCCKRNRNGDAAKSRVWMSHIHILELLMQKCSKSLYKIIQTSVPQTPKTSDINQTQKIAFPVLSCILGKLLLRRVLPFEVSWPIPKTWSWTNFWVVIWQKHRLLVKGRSFLEGQPPPYLTDQHHQLF